MKRLRPTCRKIIPSPPLGIGARRVKTTRQLAQIRPTTRPFFLGELFFFGIFYGYKNTGTQVHRYTGTQVHRYTGTQVHRYTGTQVHRYTGTPHHVLSCASHASQLVCECALCVVLCIPKEVVAQSILTKRVNVVNLESIAGRKRGWAGSACPTCVK